MCGLAGFSGITDQLTRSKLILSLGVGIDRRGGHACGFVSLDDHTKAKGLRLSKHIGKWSDSSNKFLRAATAGQVCMMHARFATCGSKDDVNDAHPFVPFRDGKPKLYGMHNGIIYDAKDSAKENKRPYTVDSKELLELLADGKYDAISKLSGYGVLTWVTPDSGAVNMVRLSAGGDFAAVLLESGGLAWASTVLILREACEDAGVATVGVYSSDSDFKVGVVYTMGPEGISEVKEHAEVRVNAKPKSYSSDDWDAAYTRGMNTYGGSYSRARNVIRYDPKDPRVGQEISYLPYTTGSLITGGDGITWEKTSTYDWEVVHIGKVYSRPTKEEWNAGLAKSPIHVDFRIMIDGTVYIRTIGDGWVKEAPIVSDLAPAQTDATPGSVPESTETLVPKTERLFSTPLPTVQLDPQRRCIHGRLVDAQCDDCDETLWTEPVVHTRMATAKTLPTLAQLDTMSDEEMAALSDSDWEAITDAYMQDAEKGVANGGQ